MTTERHSYTIDLTITAPPGIFDTDPRDVATWVEIALERDLHDRLATVRATVHEEPDEHGDIDIIAVAQPRPVDARCGRRIYMVDGSWTHTAP